MKQKIESNTMKKLAGVAVFVLAVFLLSSGPTFIFKQFGVRVRDKDVQALVNTPVALTLLIVGSMGMLVWAMLPRKLNPAWKAWLRLFVGFALILIAWLSLETLLMLSYPKQR